MSNVKLLMAGKLKARVWSQQGSYEMDTIAW